MLNAPPPRRIPAELAGPPAVHFHGAGSADDAPEASGVSLKELLRTIRRHLWLVLAAAVVCAALATYKALTDPPLYRASAVIRLVDSRKSMAGGLAGSAAMTSGVLSGDPILSQIQILRSRTVTGMVVDEEGLRLFPESAKFPLGALTGIHVAPEAAGDTVRVEFGDAGVTLRRRRDVATAPYGQPATLGDIGFTVASNPGVSAATLHVLPREVAAEILLSRLITEPRKNTDIVDVAYTANDPAMAQRVVNSVVRNFQRYNAGVAQGEAKRRREFVGGQLQYTDSLLRVSQLQLAGFRSRERVFSSQEKAASQQTSMLDLDIQREQLAAERNSYGSLLLRLQNPRVEARDAALEALIAAPAISSNPVVTQQYGQLSGYQMRYDSLTSGPRPSAATNPDVQQLASLIAGTKAKLAIAVNSQMSTIDARLDALDRLRRQNDVAMAQLPTSGTEEVRLLAQVEDLGKMASQLREEYQRAQISEAVEGGAVELVDPALPGVWVGAARIRTILFGLILGLALGSGGAVLIENLNTTIRRKDELEQLLHIPELAIVPALTSEGAKQGRLRLPVPLFGGSAPAPSRNGKDLVAANQAHSPGAEAYRTLRTNLIFSQTVQALKQIVVTSSAPSEGKSTTAANLAVTFAQQGIRVLLVDCDLRRARLHKVFHVPREPGLTQFILGLGKLDEVVQPTGVEGLFFLAAGTLPPNPAEMVGGDRMRAALAALRERYDLVILDTPPLLAASDAAILGTLVDGVLLVVRAGQTERAAAVQAVAQLNTLGVRVLGAVLNDPDSKVGKYGNHFAYEYYGVDHDDA
jgi:capsular exopolysaccharide synthesis family protein